MSKKNLKPKAVRTLLQHDSGVLRRINGEIARQTFLLHHLKAVLPSPMRPHLVAARVRDQELVLFADSSAWLTRIRFHAPQLTDHVPPQFGKPVRTKLRVFASTTAELRRGGHRLSPAAARTLVEAASGTSDDDLKAALKRLGSLHHITG
jgi:hypothetical protein